MTTTPQTTKPEDFHASIQAVRRSGPQVELVMRVSNTASRALHFIADVRAIRYDPVSRRLTLSLSDEGRQRIPSVVEQVPVFRHIDPLAEAQVVLKVPERIVKLSRSAPAGTLAFEQYPLSGVQEVVVEVAWADVPYYRDTRAAAKRDPRMPTVRWQQHTTKVVQRLNTDEPDGVGPTSL